MVSLSSCEGELHAMVSTEADALLLKHCAMLQVQWWSTYSIQTLQQRGNWHRENVWDAPSTGQRNFCGSKKLFNVDRPPWSKCRRFGTYLTWAPKFFSAKLMRVLLHELSIHGDESAAAVGQMEFEEQSARHGGSKDMVVLAKNFSRFLLLLGLE